MTWVMQFVIEFAVEVSLFAAGLVVLALGWFLVGYEHKTKLQVAAGVALMIGSYAIFLLFVLILVGEVSLLRVVGK